ncbi:LEA domain-containing protein [Schizosaccharomyces cryophilus OY26]|uniref:LEA domain-containing protein n=1 Tax=Schizosaccharomyces cryophilus (strain OY26 / ATCC MYA-4695 / CBS 11777 / NBRC 106824 / NRRL Y48691) TaxID=653667 RepID=S9VS84_SCHCR|nr:LEA domain-containing protein [Schizosaccharomyces cryophilus OY26]EPY50788.1 LEA domain-containing protein [Schizosaccharomyces cryophilus OY26]
MYIQFLFKLAVLVVSFRFFVVQSFGEIRDLRQTTMPSVHNTKTEVVQRTIYVETPYKPTSDSWPQRKLDDFLKSHGVKSLDAQAPESTLGPWKSPLQFISNLKEKYYPHESNLDELRESLSKIPELGVWIFDAWSNSELSEWLIKHNFEVPEPGTREQLLETVFQAFLESTELTNGEFESWSTHLLLSLLDEKNVRIPLGASREDLTILAKRYCSAMPEGRENPLSSRDETKELPASYMKEIIHLWSDGRLIDFLRERGIPVSVLSPREDLLREVYNERFTPRTFSPSNVLDGWSSEDLLTWLVTYRKEDSLISSVSYNSRHDLLRTAKLFYMDAVSEWTPAQLEILNDSLFSHPAISKQSSWTEDELKEELESFGELVPVPFNKQKAFERLLPHLHYYLQGPSFIRRLKHWKTALANYLKGAYILSP